jgi:hypothetical protein
MRQTSPLEQVPVQTLNSFGSPSPTQRFRQLIRLLHSKRKYLPQLILRLNIRFLSRRCRPGTTVAYVLIRSSCNQPQCNRLPSQLQERNMVSTAIQHASSTTQFKGLFTSRPVAQVAEQTSAQTPTTRCGAANEEVIESRPRFLAVLLRSLAAFTV